MAADLICFELKLLKPQSHGRQTHTTRGGEVACAEQLSFSGSRGEAHYFTVGGGSVSEVWHTGFLFVESDDMMTPWNPKLLAVSAVPPLCLVVSLWHSLYLFVSLSNLLTWHSSEPLRVRWFRTLGAPWCSQSWVQSNQYASAENLCILLNFTLSHCCIASIARQPSEDVCAVCLSELNRARCFELVAWLMSHIFFESSWCGVWGHRCWIVHNVGGGDVVFSMILPDLNLFNQHDSLGCAILDFSKIFLKP